MQWARASVPPPPHLDGLLLTSNELPRSRAGSVRNVWYSDGNAMLQCELHPVFK